MFRTSLGLKPPQKNEMLLGRFTNRILNKDALKENNICFRRQKVEIPAGLIGGVINHPRLSPPQPGSAIERSSLGCEDQRNGVQERGKFRRRRRF